MNKNVLVGIALVILLGGASLMVSKSNPTVTNNVENHQILIEKLGIGFTLPSEYVAYQTEGFEGGYGFSVSIAKEKAPGHFQFAGVRVGSFLSEHDYTDGKYYHPEEYVDIAFKNAERDPYSQVAYTTLFGNKAVRYIDQANGDPVVIGYLKLENDFQGGNVYGIKVAGETYGTAVSLDKWLFEKIVSSLKRINPENND